MARQVKVRPEESKQAAAATSRASLSAVSEEGVSIAPEVRNDPNVLRIETTIPSALPPPEEPKAPALVQYRVAWAPEKVHYGGQIVSIHPGRVVSDATHNTDALRRAGVQLVPLET